MGLGDITGDSTVDIPPWTRMSRITQDQCMHIQVHAGPGIYMSRGMKDQVYICPGVCSFQVYAHLVVDVQVYTHSRVHGSRCIHVEGYAGPGICTFRCMQIQVYTWPGARRPVYMQAQVYDCLAHPSSRVFRCNSRMEGERE